MAEDQHHVAGQSHLMLSFCHFFVVVSVVFSLCFCGCFRVFVFVLLLVPSELVCLLLAPCFSVCFFLIVSMLWLLLGSGLGT